MDLLSNLLTSLRNAEMAGEVSPFSGELVNQILNYRGIEPFMIIARDLIERVEENRKVQL